MKQNLLIREIKDIKKELIMLKERQEYLEDYLLSADDIKALAEARENLKQKKTIPLFKVKRILENFI